MIKYRRLMCTHRNLFLPSLQGRKFKIKSLMSGGSFSGVLGKKQPVNSLYGFFENSTIYELHPPNLITSLMSHLKMHSESSLLV